MLAIFLAVFFPDVFRLFAPVAFLREVLLLEDFLADAFLVEDFLLGLDAPRFEARDDARELLILRVPREDLVFDPRAKLPDDLFEDPEVLRDRRDEPPNELLRETVLLREGELLLEERADARGDEKLRDLRPLLIEDRRVEPLERLILRDPLDERSLASSTDKSPTPISKTQIRAKACTKNFFIKLSPPAKDLIYSMLRSNLSGLRIVTSLPIMQFISFFTVFRTLHA